jgi:hypothetical protein
MLGNATILCVVLLAVQQRSKAAPLQGASRLLFPRQTQPPRALRFQLSGHGMGRAAFAARCVILVNDATLGCLVQSGSKYSQFGFDFALISSGDRRIQLFLLRFNSG